MNLGHGSLIVKAELHMTIKFRNYVGVSSHLFFPLYAIRVFSIPSAGVEIYGCGQTVPDPTLFV